jgi:hypothetical protein
MVFFDITYAFYRTFRVRNFESLLLFFGAMVTLLGNAPAMKEILPIVVSIIDWVIGFPGGAASRTFVIIGAIGLILFTIRSVFGYETIIMGEE